jgi:hypothetical protein
MNTHAPITVDARCNKHSFSQYCDLPRHGTHAGSTTVFEAPRSVVAPSLEHHSVETVTQLQLLHQLIIQCHAL